MNEVVEISCRERLAARRGRGVSRGVPKRKQGVYSAEQHTVATASLVPSTLRQDHKGPSGWSLPAQHLGAEILRQAFDVDAPGATFLPHCTLVELFLHPQKNRITSSLAIRQVSATMSSWSLTIY